MLATAPEKLSFSGHESFQCRNLWLKKGYDFITNGHSFTDEDAVVHLGVGKNMVNAIRYWLKAFGMTDPNTDQPTALTNLLLADDGWDPYLEDSATLWLLHYQLVTTAWASTYSLIFNGLRRDKIEFSRINFLSFAKRQAEIGQTSLNDGTVKADFDVFVRMYLRPTNQTKDRDEGLSGVLTDLELVATARRNDEPYYVIENTEKRNLPDAVLLYGILTSGQFESSVNFTTLLTAPDQVGSIFALNATGLYTKLERLVTDKRNTAVFSDQAGIRELSFKTKPDPIAVLADYYGR